MAGRSLTWRSAGGLSTPRSPTASSDWRLSRDGLRFAVIDDGPGIPPAERELVFERFHRTDASRSRLAGGAGLGLAIVRAIAEANHGTVRAGPGPQGGARIETDLPGVVSTGRAHRLTAVRAGAPSSPR